MRRETHWNGSVTVRDSLPHCAETRAILAEPELRQRFIRQGLIPVETPTPEELKLFVREQIAYWDRTLHKIGLAGIE